MFCTYCGKPNPENSEYCVHCGKKIGGAVVKPVAAAPAIPFFKKYGGWAAITAGCMILLGYILPWASLEIGGLISQTYSALTGFFALLIGLFGSIAGASSIYSNSGSGAGGFLVFLAVIAIVPIILLFSFGITHLTAGIKMRKIKPADAASFDMYGQVLKKRSITCLVFLGIYFVFALTISSIRLGGVLGSLVGAYFYGTFLGFGFWLTTFGYILALITGINLILPEEIKEQNQN
ncbi:hypothetical protein SDC9_75281 [bioreactor metagenome]|uniref:Zinc-ribbon domain-containing protein n=1 Tax=bioreactor metagenome TaxID=1076179 RepID=A0A644YQK5_9ZZZZ